MKILLFGGSGQLGGEITARAHDLHFEVISPVASEVDVGNEEQVHFLVRQTKPDLIINCAAYTAVDLAETEQDAAYRVNRDGARFIAEAGKAAGARVFYISTDYVFDGAGSTPLREDEPTNPLSVYGASKRAGEEAVLAALPGRSLVIRTSSLHGRLGENFVHTMLKLFREKSEVRVVHDQIMSPTWAGWLAEVLLDLARIECAGVVHASCSGAISWYEFASAILELARPKLANAANVRVIPVGVAEFSRPAKRPMYSAFNCEKLAGILRRAPLEWNEGLRRHLSEISMTG